MPAYGDSLESWAKRMSALVPDGDRDWSIDAAIYLGLAFSAVLRLEKLGVDPALRNRPLIIPSLEQAWRELLYVRLNKIPIEFILRDIDRPLTLTRTGRIVDENQNPISAYRRYYGDPLHRDQSGEGNAVSGNEKRARTRRTAKSHRSKNAGSDTEHR